MKNAVIYIHGKYGTAEEAKYYKKFFKEADIIGFEYTSEYPWNFQKEFSTFFDDISENMAVIVAFSLSKSMTSYGLRCGAAIVMAQAEDILLCFH